MTCDDPVRTQDFVLGAQTSDTRVEDQIGDALPWWSDAVRAELLAQVRAH